MEPTPVSYTHLDVYKRQQEKNTSRKELNSLPYGEIKERRIALSDKEELMEKLINWNFQNKRLKNLNFGDIYLAARNEMVENPSIGIKKSTEILNITGQVIPVTLDEITICAELEDGTIVESKEKIPEVVYEKITKIKRCLLYTSRREYTIKINSSCRL